MESFWSPYNQENEIKKYEKTENKRKKHGIQIQHNSKCNAKSFVSGVEMEANMKRNSQSQMNEICITWK